RYHLINSRTAHGTRAEHSITVFDMKFQLVQIDTVIEMGNKAESGRSLLRLGIHLDGEREERDLRSIFDQFREERARQRPLLNFADDRFRLPTITQLLLGLSELDKLRLQAAR